MLEDVVVTVKSRMGYRVTALLALPGTTTAPSAFSTASTGRTRTTGGTSRRPQRRSRRAADGWLRGGSRLHHSHRSFYYCYSARASTWGPSSTRGVHTVPLCLLYSLCTHGVPCAWHWMSLDHIANLCTCLVHTVGIPRAHTHTQGQMHAGHTHTVRMSDTVFLKTKRGGGGGGKEVGAQ